MASPPEKEEGALRDAPTPKLTRLPEDKSGHPFAQPCGHPATRTTRLPDGHVHHARVTCAVCGKHLRWLPRPETVARQRVNAFKLAKLAMQPGLSDWERSFLRNVSKNRRLSAKQQSLVVRLVTQYLESTPSRHRNGIDRFNKFPSFEGKRHSEPAAFGAPQPIRRIIKTERLQKPMKRNDIYPSRWLKATDLPPGGKTLAIERVTEEAIGKDRERKAVATFEGYDKELVINSTNWDSIVELTGQDDSDNWPGHKIKLVRVQVQFGRETVEAIRIRPAIQRSSEKASVPSPVTNDEPVEFGDPY